MKDTNKTDGVFEINVLDVREQIQEDIRTYMDEYCCASIVGRDEMLDELCQIVVDNFKKLNDRDE